MVRILTAPSGLCWTGCIDWATADLRPLARMPLSVFRAFCGSSPPNDASCVAGGHTMSRIVWGGVEHYNAGMAKESHAALVMRAPSHWTKTGHNMSKIEVGHQSTWQPPLLPRDPYGHWSPEVLEASIPAAIGMGIGPQIGPIGG